MYDGPMVMTMSGIARSEWERLEVPTGYRAEMIQGELVLSSTPAQPHVVLQNQLIRMLQVPEGHWSLMGSAWQIDLDKPRVAREPQPDVIVVPRSLDPVVDPPLLAIEILSPSDNHRLERSHLTRIGGKRLDYARAGLRHYVEIGPEADGWQIRRFELQEGELVVVEAVFDVLDVAVPFPYAIDVLSLLDFGRSS